MTGDLAGDLIGGGRSLPEALRRGLTFWRRSIQARVVVSTLLLSAVVVTAVGWFLLRQVEQGLVDHRVASVLADVSNETSQLRTGLRSARLTRKLTITAPIVAANQLASDRAQRRTSTCSWPGPDREASRSLSGESC